MMHCSEESFNQRIVTVAEEFILNLCFSVNVPDISTEKIEDHNFLDYKK